LFELSKSFPDVNGNGFPDFPEFYKEGEVRQIKAASWSPILMYSNATKVMWGTTGIFLLIGSFFLWLIGRYRKKKVA